MDAKEYQEQAARTLIDNPGEFTNDEVMTVWCAMGLAGEAGETVELIKKGIFHRHGLDREKLTKELGDVLWYISGLCTVQGIDLEAVMIANIEKLRTRYPGGFTTADSITRADVEKEFDVCKCGHPAKKHVGYQASCFVHDGASYCKCEKYSPLPALLRVEQLPLIDTDK
jgi:NTP pyrophosphatase (non-canonical NTP hydrolase)